MIKRYTCHLVFAPLGEQEEFAIAIFSTSFERSNLEESLVGKYSTFPLEGATWFFAAQSQGYKCAIGRPIKADSSIHLKPAQT
jgi:hypothetical protein